MHAWPSLVTRSPNEEPREQGDRGGELDQSRGQLAEDDKQEAESQHDRRDHDEGARRRQRSTSRGHDIRGLFGGDEHALRNHFLSGRFIVMLPWMAIGPIAFAWDLRRATN